MKLLLSKNLTFQIQSRAVIKMGDTQHGKILVIVDKENTKTWTKYTKNSCKTCVATCCTMPIEIRFEDLMNLGFVTEDDLMVPLKKIVARLKKENVITAYREESGLFAFKQTAEGKCRYLQGNKCGVYKIRPLVCRAFPITMGWRHGYCPQNPIS